MFEAVEISREITGSGQNLLLCGDAYQQQPALSALAGQVQAVYIDPPFMTGETFTRRRRFGTSGWKTGRPMPEYPAYIDRFADTKEYLELLRSLIACAKALLKPTGVLYLHLDWRTSAYVRLLCDEIFGEDMFLNEIVWSYESGGRAKKYFSRKHDTILLYARSKDYHFDLRRVPLVRAEHRKNHHAPLRGRKRAELQPNHHRRQGLPLLRRCAGISGRRVERHQPFAAERPGAHGLSDAEAAEAAGSVCCCPSCAKGTWWRICAAEAARRWKPRSRWAAALSAWTRAGGDSDDSEPLGVQRP